jgi:hypothetical protein
MYVKERFVLDDYTKDAIRDIEPQFGYNGYGEFVYYRTYSRDRFELFCNLYGGEWLEENTYRFANLHSVAKICEQFNITLRDSWFQQNQIILTRKESALEVSNGSNHETYYPNNYQEGWHDTVIRVMEGTFSIRKDWYIKNYISWNEKFWQDYARKMSIAFTKMHWMPPGRGLWAMGTPFVYERGAMALYNCSATYLYNSTLPDDLSWTMDSLMLGVGVGFCPKREKRLKIKGFNHSTYDHVIEDTREAWVDSCTRLWESLIYGQPRPRMIYDEIRACGLPIKGFGGIASGPAPLKELHDNIYLMIEKHATDEYYDEVLLKTDAANLIGCCVVAGNVRRSAELASESIKDPVFKHLKNYEKYPERAAHGWMSNNQCDLEDDEDFDQLDEIAKLVIEIGEPSYKNLRNFPYGRIGKKDNVREDRGRLTNPCLSPTKSKLLTPNGIIKAGQVNVGDLIWSETGWTKVINKWSTGINEVYKYTTTAGIFYGTKNHRVVCAYRKMEVQSAVGIDVLCGQYSDEPFACKDQAVLDGLVIGDGTEKDGHVLLYIGQDDGSYFKSEVAQFIGEKYSDRTLFKVQSTIQTKELPYTYNRYVPDRYIYAGKAVVCSFLRGIYSANGSVCGNRVTLKTTSIDMVEDVQLMLSSIGIKSYYTTNKTKVVTFRNGEYRCKQSYDLNILEHKDRFNNLIGFIQPYKSEKLASVLAEEKSSGRYKDTYDIIKVELVSEEETFDITVDNHTHTYWTQGCNVSNCSEIVLEHREVCNVDETCPTRAQNNEEWLQACEYATVYCSTVSLLPTHQPTTNQVVGRNRRIGVSIIDYTGWIHRDGVNKVTKYLRQGYDRVTKVNQWVNGEAGVPEAIRKTTIKPGGTVPKLVGRTAGAGYPTFRYTKRSTRVAKNSPVHALLVKANIPYEEDVVDKHTDVFAWPILQGPAPAAEKVSIWQQTCNVIHLQREWADNAVSNTIYFQPKWVLNKSFTNEKELIQFLSDKVLNQHHLYEAIVKIESEEEDFEIQNYRVKTKFDNDSVEYKVFKYNAAHEEHMIEPVLSFAAPLTKAMSLLPHTAKGVYKQMPEEGMTEEEYHLALSKMKKIDWSELNGKSDGIDERYCQGDNCEVNLQV